MGSKTFTSEEMYKVIFVLVHNRQRFFMPSISCGHDLQITQGTTQTDFSP